MAMVKHHNKMPGYVAERSIPDDGEVVLYDGYVEGVTVGRDRWVVEHFPSNQMAFFASQKKGRAALMQLSAGNDSWNILSEPPANELEQANPPGQKTISVAETFDEAVHRMVDQDALINRMLDRSMNAILHRKVGNEIKEVPDYKTRHESDKLLIAYMVGMPVAKQVNIYRKEETFDDLIDRCREKPEWARGVAEVINRIADEAEQHHQVA